jgi:hypothetical protein
MQAELLPPTPSLEKMEALLQLNTKELKNSLEKDY